MTVENQDILKQKTPIEHSQVDMREAKESLQSWAEKKETTEASTQEAKKIIKQLVINNIPVAEVQNILSKLPLDKRLIVEKMIADEQKAELATLSQEKYKQLLQDQFLNDVPVNAGEMATALLTDTSEMYKNTLDQIAQTGIEVGASESAKEMLKHDRRIAVAATQAAESQTDTLLRQLS